jgi:hypothetical protein
MIKHLKNLLSLIVMALVLTVPQIIQAMDVAEEKAVVLFPNSNLTSDVEGLILEIVVKDDCDKFGCARHVEPICKAWNKFVNEERYISPFYKNLKVGLQTKFLYDTFCNGELVFRPNPGSDVGMIRLKISDLANPLEDTIKFPAECGDAGKFLIILTGYRKGIIKENANKVEMWFAPREFIKQELKGGRAQQFKDIFPSWKPNAQVGIFWTWANDDNLNWFDYLACSDNLTLSSKNLYENWVEAGRRWCMHPWVGGPSQKFHVHFK